MVQMNGLACSIHNIYCFDCIMVQGGGVARRAVLVLIYNLLISVVAVAAEGR